MSICHREHYVTVLMKTEKTELVACRCGWLSYGIFMWWHHIENVSNA